LRFQGSPFFRRSLSFESYLSAYGTYVIVTWQLDAMMSALRLLPLDLDSLMR
jgi:hypothetical protein